MFVTLFVKFLFCKFYPNIYKITWEIFLSIMFWGWVFVLMLALMSSLTSSHLLRLTQRREKTCLLFMARFHHSKGSRQQGPHSYTNLYSKVNDLCPSLTSSPLRFGTLNSKKKLSLEHAKERISLVD